MIIHNSLSCTTDSLYEEAFLLRMRFWIYYSHIRSLKCLFAALHWTCTYGTCSRPLTNLSELFMVREGLCGCGAVFFLVLLWEWDGCCSPSAPMPVDGGGLAWAPGRAPSFLLCFLTPIGQFSSPQILLPSFSHRVHLHTGLFLYSCSLSVSSYCCKFGITSLSNTWV